MKTFFKCTFSFKQGNPAGGFPQWTEKIEVYEVADESELNEKIAKFLANDCCGYRKHITLKDIVKL